MQTYAMNIYLLSKQLEGKLGSLTERWLVSDGHAGRIPNQDLATDPQKVVGGHYG